jgi:hypothetical protein
MSLKEINLLRLEINSVLKDHMGFTGSSISLDDHGYYIQLNILSIVANKIRKALPKTDCRIVFYYTDSKKVK